MHGYHRRLLFSFSTFPRFFPRSNNLFNILKVQTNPDQENPSRNVDQCREVEWEASPIECTVVPLFLPPRSIKFQFLFVVAFHWTSFLWRFFVSLRFCPIVTAICKFLNLVSWSSLSNCFGNCNCFYCAYIEYIWLNIFYFRIWYYCFSLFFDSFFELPIMKIIENKKIWFIDTLCIFCFEFYWRYF